MQYVANAYKQAVTFVVIHFQCVHVVITHQQPFVQYHPHDIREYLLLQHTVKRLIVFCRHVQCQRPIRVRRYRRRDILLCHSRHVRAGLVPVPFQHFGVLLYRRYVVVQILPVLRYRLRADVCRGLVHLGNNISLRYRYYQLHIQL